MKKKMSLLSILLLSVFLLGGCGEVPKLKNGSDAVVTIKGGGISVDDYYSELKNQMGLEALINLIDRQILEKEYKGELENAKDHAETTINSYIESYGGEQEFLSALQYYTNYSSIDAYKEYLRISYLQGLAVDDYAKEQISDKEINEYYKKNIVGDIEVSHILITPKVTDDMDATKKAEAEKEALDKANEALKKLKTAKKADVAETFKALVNEYSEDDATKANGGNLGYINKDTLSSGYKELVDAAYKLKDNTYNATVVKSSIGYHIVYRTNSKAKAELKDVKDSITKTLADELISSDSTVTVKALQAIRKKYDVEIQDEKLKDQYTIYIQNSLNELKKNDSK